MKKIIFIAWISFSVSIQAQNVGINKPNPNHPLDVNGNVNVDGKIIVNGIAGSTGQILKTLSSGATAWVNMGDYPNVAAYTQNGNFTVPAGITRIIVEAWGAGGGGSSGGGGAAGQYQVSIQNVTPGQVLTITTGVGGANATTNPGTASSGTNTTITGSSPFNNTTAPGGFGAFSTSPGYGLRYGTSGTSYIQYVGQSGDANTFTYAQKNSTTYTIIRKFGDGGAAGPDFNKRSQGATVSYNESTNSIIESNNPTFAPYPASGGGGGTFGEDGANGMVVIRY